MTAPESQTDWAKLALTLDPDPAHLDWDLRIYMTDEGPFGPSLKHPLCFQIPFYNANLANASVALKRQRVETDLGEGNFHGAVCFYERPHRLSMIGQWWREKRFGADVLNELLAEWWRDTEYPWQYGRVWVVRLFRAAGFVTDVEWEGVKARQPDRTLTVYRGAPAGRKLGVSWTRNPERAAWFSTRLNERGRVWVAEAPVEAVLGVLDGRGEAEVVVDPRMLLNVRAAEPQKRRGLS